ncbi:hypothetical protein [Kitasatospora purpeofusca]
MTSDACFSRTVGAERFTAHGLRDAGAEVFAGEVERTLEEEETTDR